MLFLPSLKGRLNLSSFFINALHLLTGPNPWISNPSDFFLSEDSSYSTEEININIEKLIMQGKATISEDTVYMM